MQETAIPVEPGRKPTMNKTKTKTKTTPADRRIADLLPRSMGLGANPLTAEERSEYNRLVTQRAIAQAEALNPDDADALININADGLLGHPAV